MNKTTIFKKIIELFKYIVDVYKNYLFNVVKCGLIYLVSLLLFILLISVAPIVWPKTVQEIFEPLCELLDKVIDWDIF